VFHKIYETNELKESFHYFFHPNVLHENYSLAYPVMEIAVEKGEDFRGYRF
jgi:hypothetical protein